MGADKKDVATVGADVKKVAKKVGMIEEEVGTKQTPSVHKIQFQGST